VAIRFGLPLPSIDESLDYGSGLTVTPTHPNHRHRRDRSREAGPGANVCSRRRWVLLLLALIVLSWVMIGLDLPGRWFRWAASGSIDSNKPHVAMWWTSLSRWRGGSHPEADLLDARAWVWLNQTTLAMDQLAGLERGSVDWRRLAAYSDLVLARRGLSDAADRLVNSETQWVPARDVMAAVARSALVNEQYPLAERVLEQWQARFSRDPALFYLKGLVAELQDQLELAETNYTRAFELQPDFGAATFRLGVVRRLERRFDEAESTFALCHGTPYERIGRLEQAACQWELDLLDEAWDLVEPLLDEPLAALISLYLEVDEYVDDDRPAFVAARIKSSQEAWNEAESFARRSLDMNPRNSEARSLLANVLRESGRLEESIAERDVLENLLDIRRHSGELRNQLAREPDNVELRCDLAENYLVAESVAYSMSEAMEVLRRDPRNKRAHRLLAQAYRERAKMTPEFTELARKHERLGR
jgi:Tfp pilus assembly protein PilF